MVLRWRRSSETMLDIFDTATIGAFFNDFYTEIGQPQFWVALTKIIWINVLLSGDNALVIALACRSLEPRQRMWGMILGAGVAVFLRIIFTFIVASLLTLPFLKLVGGLALLVIAAKLLVPEKADEENVQAAQHLWAAVKIVAIADIIMSLDNVIAVAAAANGSVVLLVLGLLISIPLVIFGATMLMKLMERFPIIITIGAAILGWVSGEMAVTDPSIVAWVTQNAHWLDIVGPAAGAVFVVVVGKAIAARASKEEKPAIDLANGRPKA